MRKIAPLAILACLCLLPAHADASDSDLDAVLTASEGLFKAMQAKDYPGIWGHIARKSRDTIVADVCAAMKSAPPAKASVAEDFSQGGLISRAYWDAYLEKFDPVTVLEQSTWKMGPMKADRAEVIVTFRKAQYPARLYMVREDGSWRVSLTDSFWSRK